MRLFVAGLALAVLPLAACGESCRRQSATLLGFEGEVELAMKTSPGVGVGPLVFYVKGDRMRVELKTTVLSSTPISMVYIVDTSKHVSYIIDDKSKSVVVVHTKDRSAADASAAAMTKPRKTGTDVVAGHPCTVYETTTSGGSYSVRAETCLAEDLGSPLLGPIAGLVGGNSPLEMLGGSGFPLRMRTYDGSGALLFSMEATRVERKTEPDTLFEPPAGYATVDGGIF
jgi:hypothetical protein